MMPFLLLSTFNPILSPSNKAIHRAQIKLKIALKAKN